jgi:ferredoxin
MKKFRLITQILFFVVFFVLLVMTEYGGTNEIPYPVRLFLDFDPLLLISTLFASHGIWTGVPGAFFLSLFVVVLTLFLGRVYCGWVCPLGSIHHFIGYLSSKKGLRKPENRQGPRGYQLKYLILIFLLASALLTVNLSGILDPLSLLVRSFALSINPVLNYLVRAVFDSLYFLDVKAVTAVSEPVYTLFKKLYLSFAQPHFAQAFFIGLLFFGILFLNLFKDRFWCRFLCPLGALLGLVARFSFIEMKFSKDCRHCGECASVCQGARMESKEIRWKPSECLVCYCCEGKCREGLSGFGFRLPWKRKNISGINLERRHLLTAAGLGVLTVPLLKINPAMALPSERLVRPPGAVDEKRFLERCIRCGECMKVCLTNGLQPTLFEAGLEGIWTPVLVSRLGYCEYYCTLCGQVCPTGAIEELDMEKKVKVRIGLAFIDKNRCLPYALDKPCIVCEEVCPTPKKAIWFRDQKIIDKEGRERVLKQPVVDPDLCIGCGICENKCPIVDKPAIVVTSIGESRSKTNQLPLFPDKEIFGKNPY